MGLEEMKVIDRRAVSMQIGNMLKNKHRPLRRYKGCKLKS